MSLISTLWRPVAAAILMAGATMAQAENFRMESLGPSSTAGQFGIAFVNAAQGNSDHTFQVSTGKPGTKQALMVAQGKVDFGLSTPGINHNMKNGTAMYSEVTSAPEDYKNLRGIVNFPLGAYHYVVWESSGIKSFEDLRGKKLFLGPPGGAAPRAHMAIIKALTGMEADEDYSVMRFDWTSAPPAFSDRQFDLMVMPTNPPAPMIKEFAASSTVRLLEIPAESMAEGGSLYDTVNVPGWSVTTIDPAHYAPNIANTDPISTIEIGLGFVANKDVDETAVYEVVKAFWENIDIAHQTASWMETGLTKGSVLNGMDTPLHAGAYRYYTEAGFDVPDHLRPPEAN